MHLPFGEVPSPACHAAQLTVAVAVVAPSIPGGLVAVEGVVAGLVAAAAVTGLRMAGAMMRHTWAAAGTRGARLVLAGARPVERALEGRSHWFQIRLHRLVLVRQLILVLRILLRPLVPTCMRNMQSAENS